ncbi:hypothetical protein BC936DRAFT_145032 [Jimgerdemannia flammicorona]|uniref:Zn(2)-C6 fungal-type domain-containing protein n=1 Tax=Jimgerdemannia flammicorona TaxID=994334 RepID=A0A433DM31_9FUNG|nr:hypothetical protein BC936DRAFT_145032 [Jimgerdemannia flammicorona]
MSGMSNCASERSVRLSRVCGPAISLLKGVSGSGDQVLVDIKSAYILAPQSFPPPTIMDEHLEPNGQAILSPEEQYHYEGPFPDSSYENPKFLSVSVSTVLGSQWNSHGMVDPDLVTTTNNPSNPNDPVPSIITPSNLDLPLDANPPTKMVVDIEGGPQGPIKFLYGIKRTRDNQSIEIIQQNPGSFEKKDRRPKSKVEKPKKVNRPMACNRCNRMKKGCDRGSPCGRCVKRGILCVEQVQTKKPQAENSKKAKLEFDPELLPVIDPTGLTTRLDNGDEGGSNDGGPSNDDGVEDRGGDVEMKNNEGGPSDGGPSNDDGVEDKGDDVEMSDEGGSNDGGRSNDDGVEDRSRSVKRFAVRVLNCVARWATSGRNALSPPKHH